MADDAVDFLLSELTALRRSVEHLARSSLTKGEAETLNKSVVQAAGRMERAAQDAPKALGSALKADRVLMASDTTEAAVEAITGVLADIRRQLDQERVKFAQAAGEVRRAAWRSFGGFWSWALCLLATGAVLGMLLVQITETGRSLFRIKDMVRYGCGWITVGGTVIEGDDGSSWCAFWIVDPETAKYRRERDQGE